MKNSIKIMLFILVSIFFTHSIFSIEKNYHNIKFEDNVTHSILKKVDGKYIEFKYEHEKFKSDNQKLSNFEKPVSQILIFPNPADNSINIEYNYELKASRIEIYNLIGNLESTYNFNTIIDIQDLRVGFYIVHIIDEHENIIYRSKLLKR